LSGTPKDTLMAIDHEDIAEDLADAIAEVEAPAEVAEPADVEPSASMASAVTDGETPDAKGEADADGTKTASVSDKTAAPDPEAEITRHWSDADKYTLSQSPEARDLLLRRHAEMEQAFAEKTKAHAKLREHYEPVDRMFAPWRDRMRAAGWTPRTLVEGWAGVEKRMMAGEGAEVVAGLINHYKIDPNRLAQALGLPPGSFGQAQQVASAAVPREIAALKTAIDQRFAAEDRKRATEAIAYHQQAEARAAREVAQFRGAKDAKGNLRYPHFDNVEAAMTKRAVEAIRAGKPVPSLRDLYDDAVFALPASAAARERAQQAARAKLASRQAPDRSLGEEIMAAMASAKPLGAPDHPTGHRMAARMARR
jgi:hypothetical protein